MPNLNLTSDDREVEVIMEVDSDNICVVPTEDVMLEIIWSDKYGCLICVARVKPTMD